MQDGSAAPGTPPELVSFHDWSIISDDVAAEVDRSAYAQEREVKWVWPRVRERIDRCGVLIGPSAIEIRPYHPPTSVNTGYSRAKQRIYLSATLGSMDDLQRRVGSGRIARLATAQPLPVGATGERKFVLNSSGRDPFDPTVLGWVFDQGAGRRRTGRLALRQSH